MPNLFNFVKAFSSEDLNSWKDAIIENGNANPQDQSSIVIDRVDLYDHTNYSSYHYDSHEDTSHSNSPSVHSDNGKHDNTYYAHENGHTPMQGNSGGTHVNGTYGYYRDEFYNPHYGKVEYGPEKPVHKDTYEGGGHYDYHTHYGGGEHQSHDNSGWPHANATRKKHENTHSNSSSPHSDTPYSQSGHYNYVPHSDYTYYNQQHVNHDNFIPAKPKLFNLDEETPTRVSGKQELKMFSYDANVYGRGSDWKISKTVEYKIEIRKVADLEGKPSVSKWVVLRNYSTSETYTFDSLDPFKEGNKDANKSNGYYELRVTPRNPDYRTSGYPSVLYQFVGKPNITKILIEQNNDPELEVTNPKEFIGFTFGKANALSDSGTMKKYDEHLYKNAPIDCVNGIFVEVSAKDKDTRDYLKGNAKLLSGNGSVLSVSKIIWSNGKDVVKSNGKPISGYVFFPLNEALSQKEKHDFAAEIEITLSDFLDEACRVPSGSTIIQRKVSSKDQTIMYVNLDTLPPNIEYTQDPTSWTNKHVLLNINSNDITGVLHVVNPDGTKIEAGKNQFVSYKYTVLENGDYKFVSTDKVGNTTTKLIKVSNIDKEPPEISASKKGADKISLTITDKLSGLNQRELWYQMSNSADPNLIGGWKKATPSMTLPLINGKPYLHVTAMDNAGNSSYKVFGPFVLSELIVTAVKDISWMSESYPIKYDALKFPLGGKYKFLDNDIKLGYSVSFNIKGLELTGSDSISASYSFFDENGSPLIIYSDGERLEDLDSRENTGYTVQSGPVTSVGDCSYFKHFLPANSVSTYVNGDPYNGKILVRASITTNIGGNPFTQNFDLYCVDSSNSVFDDLYLDKQR